MVGLLTVLFSLFLPLSNHNLHPGNPENELVQRLHVTALCFRLAGNTGFDFFLYVHINIKLRID